MRSDFGLRIRKETNPSKGREGKLEAIPQREGNWEEAERKQQNEAISGETAQKAVKISGWERLATEE